MKHKPRNRQSLMRARPFGFSSFARSIVAAASSKKVRKSIKNSKNQVKQGPRNHGNGGKNLSWRNKTINSDSDDEEEFQEVQADFAFFDPKASDFHGVKILLQTFLDNKEWDLSGFVDLIMEQTTVGTVVKIENDEDESIYAVASALNLDRYKKYECIRELKDFLLNACREESVLSSLRSILEEQAKEVGLLVSRRVVNLPPQLLPPLYDSLFDEVSWATEDEPTDELRNYYRFKHYLVISKVHVYKHSNRRSGPSSNPREAIIYVKPEDEIFHELSSWSFNFPMHSQQVTDKEFKDYCMMGLVMAVEVGKIPTFREQLHSLIIN
ncbi:hypothetical protein LIER_24444 [Lithospermum erythrorhizon]|uniref:Protein BCCIP homolog n=1 Tax=Lithospermum erythrorhizon TaxID=34254 RepID=A0AAV3R4F0_LITER